MSKPLIVVVGVGNQGSHFVLFARNFDARIKVIDHDRVEAKNVASQAHTVMGQGQLKARALTQMMQGLFRLRIQAAPRKVEAHNIDPLLEGADLVVDCLDNWTARSLITNYTRDHEIPCVHVGVDQNGSYGHVRWDENFKIEGADGAEQEATCEDGETLPFNVGVTSELAQAVQIWLTSGRRREATVTVAGVSRRFI